jgi:REP element-mobilizing transposase RayT
MSENEYIHKSHHVPVMLYHFVCPAKYRRVVVSKEVDKTLKDTCPEIEKRYEIHFLEIGTDNNHVHFLIQSIPRISPTQIVTIVKSITAREVFRKNPKVKEKLLGGEFWSDGYFENTVSKFGDETSISKYLRDQGLEKEYVVLHQSKQLVLF